MAKISKKNIELISPAGNIDKLRTSLAFGADAVYVGLPEFSLRVRINNFDEETLAEAVNYCHQLGKKIYITINIFAHNRHLKILPTHIRKLRQLNVDGLVLSDPGFLRIVKKEWPKAPIHLSTQANCTNIEAVEFWREQGVERIILGREVTLNEIKEIHNKCPEIELEYFVHGAMCMSYSGRCFISKLSSGRSANQGDCIQPCRWQYTIRSDERGENDLRLEEDQHGSYILNSKDLCLLNHLDKLIDAGVNHFKIEGRAKSVYYQAMVAGIYSEVIAKVKSLKKKDFDRYFVDLNTKIKHRGYTTGFLLGDKGEQNTSASHEECDWEFCGQVIGEDKDKSIIKVHNSIKLGDELEIVQPKYDIINTRVEKILNAKTGEILDEAHGGQGQAIILNNLHIPQYSVIRRKIN